MSDDTILLRPFTAQDTPWLTQAHIDHYAASDGFDASFGALVHDILTAFANDHDAASERGWIAQRGTQNLGSIFCVRANKTTAKLRLFYLDAHVRGQGLGQRLLDTCIHFARDAGYTSLTLWTHESHAAAGALYLRRGFDLKSRTPKQSFGVDVIEQHWELIL